MRSFFLHKLNEVKVVLSFFNLLGGSTIFGVNIAVFITILDCLPIPISFSISFCSLLAGSLLVPLLPIGLHQLVPAGDGDCDGDGDGDGDGPPILNYGDGDDHEALAHHT